MEDITTPFHTGDEKKEEKPLEATPAPASAPEPVKEEKKEPEVAAAPQAPADNNPAPANPTPEATPAPAAPAATPAAPEAPATAPAAVPVGTTPEDSPAAAFPAELKGWNWGAFFLSWIWAIGNQTWIGLLSLLGPLDLIMRIVLGIKGNEWAWQNRKFESVDQFKAVQKAWAKWGLILFIISTVIMIGLIVLSVVAGVGAAQEKALDYELGQPINLTQ